MKERDNEAETEEAPAVPEIEPVENIEARNNWCLAAGEACMTERDNEAEPEEAPAVPEVEPVEDIEARNKWCLSSGQPC